jgi:hypothetical protein
MKREGEKECRAEQSSAVQCSAVQCRCHLRTPDELCCLIQSRRHYFLDPAPAPAPAPVLVPVPDPDPVLVPDPDPGLDRAHSEDAATKIT